MKSPTNEKIQTSQSTPDAGILSVGDQNLPITLQSVGDGPVLVHDMVAADSEHFVIFDWATSDSDGDGVKTAQIGRTSSGKTSQ